MTNIFEGSGAPESIEKELSNSFQEIKQDIEKDYPNPIVLDGKNDTVQKSIRDELSPFITNFPKKLEEKNLEGLNTLTTQTKQSLTDRTLKKAQAISEANNANVSITDEGFQRYADITSLLETIINASAVTPEDSQ